MTHLSREIPRPIQQIPNLCIHFHASRSESQTIAILYVERVRLFLGHSSLQFI